MRISKETSTQYLHSFVKSSWSARSETRMIIFSFNILLQPLNFLSSAPLFPWPCARIRENWQYAMHWPLPPLVCCHLVNLIYKMIECIFIPIEKTYIEYKFDFLTGCNIYLVFFILIGVNLCFLRAFCKLNPKFYNIEKHVEFLEFAFILLFWFKTEVNLKPRLSREKITTIVLHCSILN